MKSPPRCTPHSCHKRVRSPRSIFVVTSAAAALRRISAQHSAVAAFVALACGRPARVAAWGQQRCDRCRQRCGSLLVTFVIAVRRRCSSSPVVVAARSRRQPKKKKGDGEGPYELCLCARKYGS